MHPNTFKSAGVEASLCQVLQKLGFEEPTPIQAQAIPAVLSGQDLLAIAQTGTGKTAAFALPVLQRLMASKKKAAPGTVSALILSPTRELALQIRDEISRFTQGAKIRHACVFGGVSRRPQEKVLASGVDVLVATPGRLLDLLNDRCLDLSRVSHLVLDEADRLLDMGFIRDVKRIVRALPRERQSLLFSATMPPAIADLASSILSEPARIDVSPQRVTVEKIEQGVLMVDTSEKQRALEKMLFDPNVTRAIVFTRTKHGANRVAKKLEKAGIVAEAIHGNKSQNARQRALSNFKSGEAWVLVATDVAARGIDIPAVSHVINFELPQEAESYVHRIGRTARAGTRGVAWSLVDASERSRLRGIERLTKVRPALLEVDGVAAGTQTQSQPQTQPQPHKKAPADNAQATSAPKRRRSRRRRPNRAA